MSQRLWAFSRIQRIAVNVNTELVSARVVAFAAAPRPHIATTDVAALMVPFVPLAIRTTDIVLHALATDLRHRREKYRQWCMEE